VTFWALVAGLKYVSQGLGFQLNIIRLEFLRKLLIMTSTLEIAIRNTKYDVIKLILG
jgi:hypothetical protein